MFRKDSIMARARQVLRVEKGLEANIKQNFISQITKYHPDKHGPRYKAQTGVLIEAYQVLTGRVKPVDCTLMEDDELVSSLLPAGVKPVTLGMRYGDWLIDRFYDFVKP